MSLLMFNSEHCIYIHHPKIFCTANWMHEQGGKDGTCRICIVLNPSSSQLLALPWDMKAILRAPGLCDRGWVLTPPSWPCLSLPSPAVWVNGEPRNGEEILHVTPPTYAPTIGGLLTKPSTIPNPRLSPAIKCWAAMQFITHLLSPNQAEFSICLQVAISTFQWRLIS